MEVGQIVTYQTETDLIDLEQKMGIRPLYDRVLIQRVEEETTQQLDQLQTVSTHRALRHN